MLTIKLVALGAGCAIIGVVAGGILALVAFKMSKEKVRGFNE